MVEDQINDKTDLLKVSFYITNENDRSLKEFARIFSYLVII